MKEYHKINTLYKRDMQSKHKKLIIGEYSQPEFEYLANNDWEWTEKVDGTNIRIMWDDGQVRFGGKTDNASIPTKLLDNLQDTFPDDAKFREAFSDLSGEVCLYGEGYGAKIQKGGGNYRSDQGFVLFDIRIGHWWLKREDVEDVGRKMGLDVVPVIGSGTLTDAVRFVSNGFQSRWGEFPAEGIVARPAVPLQTRAGHRIITKIKACDFQQAN